MPKAERLHFPPPANESVVQRIPGSHLVMEWRGEQTLFWSDDWWDGGSPLGVMDGLLNLATATGWAAGYARGRVVGNDEGHREGFRACQAGLRSLLGALGSSDFDTFMQAANRS